MYLFTDMPSNKWSVIIFLATEESYRKLLEKIHIHTQHTHTHTHTHTHQTTDKAKDSQDDKGKQSLDTEHLLGSMRPAEFSNFFLPLPSALIPVRQGKFYTPHTHSVDVLSPFCFPGYAQLIWTTDF